MKTDLVFKDGKNQVTFFSLNEDAETVGKRIKLFFTEQKFDVDENILLSSNADKVANSAIAFTNDQGFTVGIPAYYFTRYNWTIEKMNE